MINFFKKNIIIILYVIFLLQIGLFFIVYGAKDFKVHDFFYNFGLNFFTEILGVAITVFIIERLIEDQKKRNTEEENLPLLSIQYEDTRLFVSRFLSFWIKAYEQGVPDPIPEKLEDFVSEPIFNKIFEHLYLRNAAPTFPLQDWGEYAVRYTRELKILGQRIIDHKNSVIEHKALLSLSRVIESPFFNTILSISDIREYDRSSGLVRPQIFRCHTVPPSADELSHLLYLINWCNTTYEILADKFPKADHKMIAKYNIDQNRKTPPPAMADPEVIKKETIHSGLGGAINTKET